ncbi:MAG: hypothetical protein ACRDKJ_10935 [Actinomycetota bacterium]
MTEGGDPTAEIGTPEPVTSAAATAALPLIDERQPVRPVVIALTFLVVAAGAFLAGIAFASTIKEDLPGTVLASQRIGPSGGTVRFSGGEIRVPSGAVASSTTITVRRTVVGQRVQVRPPGRRIQVFDPGELVAYVFEPEDADFLRPVTLVFRLRDGAGDATAFARVGEATLFLSGGGIDTERGVVAVEVSDFRFNRGRPVEAGR